MVTKKTKRVNSLGKVIKDLKSKFSFEITKQPANVKKMRTYMIIRGIIVNFLFSIFAFSIKGSQLAIQHNLPILSVMLLALYFSERIVESAYNTYDELQKDNFRQVYSSVIIGIIMDLTCKTRGKVLKKNENGIENVMPHPELIKKSKDYIDGVWNFWWNLPVTIANVAILVVMIAITLKMELADSSFTEAIFVMILLFLCVIIYFFFGKKRIDVMKKFRKKRKENEAREEVLFSEIKSIEFASQKDFMYHANRFREHSVNSIKLLTSERLKLNAVFVKRNAVASFFMISILIYKILVSGEITEEVILGIVAVSTVYSTILSKISDILQNVENTMNYFIDVDKLYSDFSNIYSVYCIEKEKEDRLGESEEELESTKIKIGEFVFSYNERNSWSLVNPNPFELLLGEVGFVRGETGSGKTTSLNVFNGNVRMPRSPISLGNGQIGYLKTLTYHTDRSMADNFILNEIVLSDDYSVVDKPKLFEILEGLTLKPVFLTLVKHDEAFKGFENEEDLIMEFMKLRTYKQFSSGQQQRIALAKLLYTLDSSIQAIWLDEAFNRLNDEIAEQCVKFILEYVQRDRKRLVLIASHQVDIVRPYCSKEISFERSEDGSSIIKLQQI